MPSLTWGLRRAAEVRPAGLATIDGGRRRSWVEVCQRVARLAGALRAAGLGAGGRVAVLGLNGDRYFEALLATLWAGGVVVPVNTRLAALEIDYVLADSGAELLLVDGTFAALPPRLPAAAAMKRVLALEAVDDLVAAHGPIEDARRSGHDLAGLFYTGGTTGRAKGVMLSHRNLVSNALNAIIGCGFDRDSVYLHAAPMFHLADGGPTFAVTLAAGTHAFVPRFEPLAVLQAIAAHRVSHIAMVPTMVNLLVNHPAAAEHDLSSMRDIPYGAAPMPEAVLRRAMRLMPQAAFHHSYGMTETSPLATMMVGEDATVAMLLERRLASCGQALPTVEVRVVDPEGRELPRGAVGEVVMRGPTVMLGYWNKPEETAKALRDGWMWSGDAGRIDEEGFLYVVDRLKDVIITGGENVYSAEVESVLSLVDGVQECAVIGVPDATWGERVHAILVPKPGATLTAEAAIAHCRERLAGFKCPRSVEIRQESLPLSGAGKILKSELRKTVAAKA